MLFKHFVYNGFSSQMKLRRKSYRNSWFYLVLYVYLWGIICSILSLLHPCSAHTCMTFYQRIYAVVNAKANCYLISYFYLILILLLKIIIILTPAYILCTTFFRVKTLRTVLLCRAQCR